jgi:NADH-quinone oxidoreductase subunit C|tara:strand:+ start:131 stop:610 length:480 start_codon:yes stop_codon:yes gene_type:complete
MDINELMQKLSAREGVSNVSLVRNNVIKCDIEKDLSKEFFKDLKNEFGFEHCSLITAIDNQPEFELVYHFTSVNKSVTVDSSDLSVMVEIHIYLDRDSPTIESISDLWGGANWHEREAFDLMGIYFLGHPDLRRVLLPEGFAGHPLRKDYVYEIHEEEW